MQNRREELHAAFIALKLCTLALAHRDIAAIARSPAGCQYHSRTVMITEASRHADVSPEKRALTYDAVSFMQLHFG